MSATLLGWRNCQWKIAEDFYNQWHEKVELPDFWATMCGPASNMRLHLDVQAFWWAKNVYDPPVPSMSRYEPTHDEGSHPD